MGAVPGGNKQRKPVTPINTRQGGGRKNAAWGGASNKQDIPRLLVALAVLAIFIILNMSVKP